jgi:L-idonate 5-dehydrogenase
MTEAHAPNLGLVVHAAGDARVEEMPAPDPSADEALITVAYGGICGSDLHYWTDGAAGASILREPLLLGHEIVGTVLAPAADGTGPTAGTEVAVHPATVVDDGRTPWPRDRENLSPAGTYLGSAAHLPHTQGAFARRVALPARMLQPLPDGLDLRTAAVAEPASVAWHGVERAGDVRGKKALVVGAGPIGLLAVAVLRHHGADTVLAADLYQRPLEVARQVGADDVLDARDAEALADVAADVVVEASGSVPGLANAVAATVRGGHLVMLGLQAAGNVPAPLATAITRELTLHGSFRFDRELGPVLQALADGSLVTGPVVSDEFPIEEGLDALVRAKDAQQSSKVLLRF